MPCLCWVWCINQRKNNGFQIWMFCLFFYPELVNVFHTIMKLMCKDQAFYMYFLLRFIVCIKVVGPTDKGCDSVCICVGIRRYWYDFVFCIVLVRFGVICFYPEQKKRKCRCFIINTLHRLTMPRNRTWYKWHLHEIRYCFK